MNKKLYIFVSILIAIFCGFVSSHSFLSHSWTSIFWWIGVGLLVLYLSPSRKDGIYGGALFGFITLAVWLITGFNGTANKIPQLSVIILIAGIIGALTGVIGALIFYRLFRKNI